LKHYRIFKSRIGWVGLVWSKQKLLKLELPHTSKASAKTYLLKNHQQACISSDNPQWVNGFVDKLSKYFDGETVSFSSIPIDVSGMTEFQQKVYAGARKIGYGKVVKYGDLAKAIGSAGAFRAVGGALGKNPVPIVVPCHRIMAANGIGGFSAPGGTTTKKVLLKLEGYTI
jgi:methylated-DNA-[protein]-cysteine S-methyltransferase